MNQHNTFTQLCDAYCTTYLLVNGERKFQTVLDKVMTSNKVSGLISTSRYKMARLDGKTILACLHEIPYFMFSRNETMALAGLLALTRWNAEANLYAALADDDRLLEIARFIVTELRCTNF